MTSILDQPPKIWSFSYPRSKQRSSGFQVYIYIMSIVIYIYMLSPPPRPPQSNQIVSFKPLVFLMVALVCIGFVDGCIGFVDGCIAFVKGCKHIGDGVLSLV